jgi:CubicO group peptidase (beta-lactamase class C family)
VQFPISGTVNPGFEPVREVFERNFHEDVEVGASLCIVHRGEMVVDLWGGFQDLAGELPWEAATLVNVYSSTKGIAAIAFATLIEDGLLSLEDPVSNYWPELRAAQGGLTVGQLLAHQGGLCGVDEPLEVADLYDWEKMTGLLERQAPYWEPGTAAGYHAVVWGYLPGEIVRRLCGCTLGELLKERVAGPLNADFYLGLPDERHHRVAPMVGPNRARIQPDPALFTGQKVTPLYPVALQNPLIRPYQDASSAAWRRAEIASSNGHGSARGIATIYGSVAAPEQGSAILAAATLARLVEQRVGMEDDLVLGRSVRRGAGVILNTNEGYGPNEDAWGHSGAGGSIGFADPQTGTGFGYVMNQMQNNIDDDTRSGRLIRAYFRCLEGEG